MEECSKLIGQTAGYTLNGKEEVLLKSTVEKRQWRLIPPVMARWGCSKLAPYIATQH
jgi:hypothetical protein